MWKALNSLGNRPNLAPSKARGFSLGSVSLEIPHGAHQKAVSKKQGALIGSLGSVTNPFESHLPDSEDSEAPPKHLCSSVPGP